MVLTHTCESAGLLKNIKVNGQTRAAKLSGILFTWWHVTLVNWTFQLTDGYICSCPSLTPFSPPPKSSTYEICFTFSLSSFSQPLSFISPIDWFLFPSWGCLFFSSFRFHSSSTQTCAYFSCIWSPPNLAFIGWHVPFDYSLSCLKLGLFWPFTQLHAGLPLNLLWLSLILSCSWTSMPIVALVEGGFWLPCRQLLKFYYTL